MPDRKKVIKGLEELSGFLFKEYGKAQAEEASLYYDRFLTVDNALSLLREQEAVEPVCEQDSMVCGNCGHEVIWQRLLGDGVWLDEQLDYCPKCGKQVKWE